MLERKAYSQLEVWNSLDKKKALLLDGARQIGKSYLVKAFGETHFKNVIVMDFKKDKRAKEVFQKIYDRDDLLMKVRIYYRKDFDFRDTLLFFDEIQENPDVFSFAKDLVESQKYNIAFAGSLLGVTIRDYLSDPLGSLFPIKMYPLDFEEFLWANGFSKTVVAKVKTCFENSIPVDEAIHKELMHLFRLYLVVGGMPDVVNEYLKSHDNIRINSIKRSIHQGYIEDISKYALSDKLIIDEIYDMMPSELQSKNKRFILKNLNEHQRYSRYENDFVWLVNSGVALKDDCVTNPIFPLKQSESRNLFKLYFSDVGLLSYLLYEGNEDKILNNVPSVNLGTLYENVVAQELVAHGYPLYYYDNKKKGEVDFLIEDFDKVIPLEVKSGKDYQIHSALNKLLDEDNDSIQKAYVLNQDNLKVKDKKTYIPIYMTMFFQKKQQKRIEIR